MHTSSFPRTLKGYLHQLHKVGDAPFHFQRDHIPMELNWKKMRTTMYLLCNYCIQSSEIKNDSLFFVWKHQITYWENKVCYVDMTRRCHLKSQKAVTLFAYNHDKIVDFRLNKSETNHCTIQLWYTQYRNSQSVFIYKFCWSRTTEVQFREGNCV